MERKGTLVAITGVVVTAVTLAVFILLLPPLSIMGWLCLVFAAVAEVVGFSAVLLLGYAPGVGSKTLLHSGTGAAVGIYMALAVGLSVLFRLNLLWVGFMGLFVSLQLILLGGLVIVLAALLHFAQNADGQERAALGSADKMRSISQHVALLATSLTGEDATTLTKAAEDILHTDLTVVVDGDAALQDAVVALDLELNLPQPDAQTLTAQVARIQKLVRQRQIVLSHAKHGRI